MGVRGIQRNTAHKPSSPTGMLMKKFQRQLA